jgi:hypothetical protein
VAVYGPSHSPFTPEAVRDAGSTGLRRSVQRIINLIDTTEPAWPSIAATLREFTEAGIEIDEQSAPMAIKLGRQRWAEIAPEGTAVAQACLAAAAASIAYYVSRGPLIKIGTTTDPATRFRDLMPDEILAVEPGGRAIEAMRHEQFLHLHASGEHFRDEPELRDHVAAIRRQYGEPDPAWPTTKTASSTRKRPWRLTAPASNDTLTGAQAEAQLGIKEVTIRGWVRRRKIQVAGWDDEGRHLFNREHLIAVRDSRWKRLDSRL